MNEDFADRLIFVDVEANGPCPAIGSNRMTEFGAVHFTSRRTFHWTEKDEPIGTGIDRFYDWILEVTTDRPIFVSDNPAYDWQWINHAFHTYIRTNPFGHSARRIGDFYAGLANDFAHASRWKRLRITTHDHHPVHDAQGNVEAFHRLIQGERP